jgi:hypothetical protein
VHVADGKRAARGRTLFKISTKRLKNFRGLAGCCVASSAPLFFIQSYNKFLHSVMEE